MTNTNCLDGIKCPKCGNEDTFRIEVTTMATVTDDGAEVEHVDMDWDETSYAECAGCYKFGQLSHFKVQSEVPPGAPLPLTLPDALHALLSHIEEDVPLENVSRHFRDALDNARALANDRRAV